ncbi:hypothetical protein CDAR_189151 [Caerostris darwini]|uniref:Uncharacterized protein n=1 Tax=Caerostris darwini TaxID=1538125 RepID=A0AAV4SQY8_9ARAC|nr:hypothetical protein CDAR_189151 [Caerostris darwini]
MHIFVCLESVRISESLFCERGSVGLHSITRDVIFATLLTITFLFLVFDLQNYLFIKVIAPTKTHSETKDKSILGKSLRLSNLTQIGAAARFAFKTSPVTYAPRPPNGRACDVAS